MKVFVVHYSKLRYRRRYLENKLQGMGYDYTFVTDYDKESLDEKLLNKFYSDNKEEYQEKTSGLWSGPESNYRKLSLEEISCTIKHFECIRLASLESSPSLIIEDDCVFFDDFNEKLLSIISEIEYNEISWDSVFLGLGCGKDFQKYYLSKSGTRISDKLYRINHPATNCAECYLINNESAKRIVDNCYPFNMISDWELAFTFKRLDMKILWSIPSIAWQGSKDGKFVSTLDYGQR